MTIQNPKNLSNSDSPKPIYDGPSKSQVKRDMHDLLDLGKEVVALSRDQVKQLPLSERLEDAVFLAQKTTSREGRRRQIHFVGKLMRDAPADLIRQQLETWAKGSVEDTRAMHYLETLRERLLASDEALTEWLSKNPGVDVQAIRAQIRAARREQSANATLNPGQEPQRKNFRALFQTLKSVQANTVSALPSSSNEEDNDA